MDGADSESVEEIREIGKNQKPQTQNRNLKPKTREENGQKREEQQKKEERRTQRLFSHPQKGTSLALRALGLSTGWPGMSDPL